MFLIVTWFDSWWRHHLLVGGKRKIKLATLVSTTRGKWGKFPSGEKLREKNQYGVDDREVCTLLESVIEIKSRGGERSSRESSFAVNVKVSETELHQQLICQKCADVIASGGNNVVKNDSDNPVANGERKMSALKPTSTAGSPRIIPIIGHLKYEHLFAGVSGGAVSTLLLHPLDLIKIRFAGLF